MKFQFQCVDAEGKTRQGTVSAESVETAMAKVKSKGLWLTSIDRIEDAVPPPQQAAPPIPAPATSPNQTSSTTVRGSWPVTLLLVLGAMCLSGFVGLAGRLGLLVAVIPVVLIVRSDWRKTCFEFVRLNKKMTTTQQFVLLGAMAFFFAVASTVDPGDSSTQVAKEDNSASPVSPSEGASQSAINATPATPTIQAKPDSVASDSAPEWWSGGTLGGKTSQDWQDASPENKLATCAGLIAVMWNDYPVHITILSDRRRSEVTPNDFRPYAEELVVFIDKAFEKNPDPNQKIAEMAATGMAQLNWTRSINEVSAEKLKQRLRVDHPSVEINDFADDPTQKIVLVRWDIGDNLTEGMVRSGAQIDVVAILGAVRESGISIREVTVFGSFQMVDKFGNTSKDVVLKATYSGDTLKKINFENFLYRPYALRRSPRSVAGLRRGQFAMRPANSRPVR